MGAAIELFEGARTIGVGRDRFVPVKTTDDLLVLRSDCYRSDEDDLLRQTVERLPFVELGPGYKLIDDFEQRFADGPPSLADATSLVVRGDWRFGPGVRRRRHRRARTGGRRGPRGHRPRRRRRVTPEEIADELAGDFVARHGRRPDGVYAAPGRVNLIGEHVDYNDGRCLPIALRDATYAAVAARDDDVVTVVSRQQDGRFEGRLAELGPGHVTGWAAYVAGVMWAAQADGIRVPGVDVVVHGTVPVAAGLSSSASLSCATGLGVCAAAGLPLDEATRRRLVEICGRAEREVAGAPTGGMDQTASLLAREGYALLLDCRDRSVRHVPWRPEALGAVLVVVDTRASHELGDGQYGARRDECERAARELGVASLREVVDDPGALARLTDPVLHRRTRHVVSEIARVDATVDAIGRGDLSRRRRAVRRVPRVAARRLRGLVPRARHRVRRGTAGRGVRRPHDGRRLRRVGHRAGAGRRRRRGAGVGRGRLRVPGLATAAVRRRCRRRRRPPDRAAR